MGSVKVSESLADFVARVRREKELSLADVERQSARHGQRIAGSYVNRIENGLKTKPSADRLVALAHGLGISEAEIFAASQGKSLTPPSAIEERLLERFRQLPDSTQNDLIRILDTLHREHALPAPGVKPARRRQSRAA